MSQMQFLDILVLVLYILGISAAGLYFGRRAKSTEAYFLGNRNFPAWAIGLSMVGTSISSISFLGFPGDAFKTAWLRMVPNFMLPIGILIASIWFLPFFRRGKITSAFEYLEGRFGASTHVYGAAAFIISQLVRISLILFLVSQLVHVFTGWDYWICILTGGIFVAFYTVVGGIEAVIWTDVVQTVILIFGGLFCMFVILRELPGGLGTIISEAREAGKFQFAEYVEDTRTFKPASWDFTFFRKTALMMLFIGLTNWLYEYSCNQNVIQRYCASRSMRDARKAMWICCFSSIPIWAFFMFLGTALWVFFQHFPTPETSAMLSGESKAEEVLPFFILEFLPAGIAGLVIAAVLAAAMSSLDSSINAIATVSVVDIYRRHLAKDADDAHHLRAARYIAIATSVVMVIGALLLQYSEGTTVQDTATVLIALTLGGLLGLYMLGFLTTWGDARAVGVAIVCTMIFSGYRALEMLGLFPALPFDHYYTGILGHVIMFVVGFSFALLLPKRPRDLTNLTLWTQTSDPID